MTEQAGAIIIEVGKPKDRRPIRDRREKWRMWRDRENGLWFAMQPTDDGHAEMPPLFRADLGEGTSMLSYAFANPSPRRVHNELLLARAKEATAL